MRARLHPSDYIIRGRKIGEVRHSADAAVRCIPRKDEWEGFLALWTEIRL